MNKFVINNKLSNNVILSYKKSGRDLLICIFQDSSHAEAGSCLSQPYERMTST